MEERDHMGRTRAEWEAAQRKGHNGNWCLDCQTECADDCDCCIEWSRTLAGEPSR